jgi:hypothetical protein
MRSLALIALLLASVTRAAERTVELNASGISVPFFDPAGKLTHRMIASHGSMAGNLQHLQEVELVYFSATEPNVIVQKLIAADATWDDKKEVLSGRGPILVATEENRLTGEGFDCALATSVLHIHRDFKMENVELVVTSDRATVDLLVERTGEDVKVRDVKRCEAIGHLQIVVQPTAKKRYDFVKAFSEIAIYDGAKRTIELPRQIRYLKKDGREVVSNTLTIKLPPPKAPAKK